MKRFLAIMLVLCALFTLTACSDGPLIATALYRHTCGYAKEMGCQFVTLNVWCGNDGAMRFYENLGLRPRHIMMELPLEDPKC